MENKKGLSQRKSVKDMEKKGSENSHSNKVHSYSKRLLDKGTC